MRLARLFSKTLPRDYWHLWDTFYKYKPVSMDIHTWIPPFSGMVYVCISFHTLM